MNRKSLVLGVVLTATGAVVGYGIARFGSHVGEATVGNEPADATVVANRKMERRVLYWYDPMMPGQHFDKPGKSPFMDMDLKPKYAEDDSGIPGLALPMSATQALGLRLATAEYREIAPSFEALGTTQLDASDVAVVQARTGGYVRRVVARIPGETVREGSTLLEMVAPEWTAAQQEYLSLTRSADDSLVAAARQRLLFLGMPDGLVKQLERSGEVQPAVITVPIDGVLKELAVRDGMAVSPGMTLATINGVSRIWIEVAVPEARAGQVGVGQEINVMLPSLPGTTLKGAVKSVLAEGNTDLRTVRVRIALPNRDGRVQAGLSAVVRFQGATQLAVVVPSEAVIRTGTRAIVYVAGSDGKLRPVTVRPGREFGNEIVIENGIEDGERIVVSGQFLIDSESSLRGILPVDVNGEGGAAGSDTPTAPPTPSPHAGHGGM